MIEAIAAGQKAASSIKRYLEGKELVPRIEREDEKVFQVPLTEEEKEIKQNPRIVPKRLHLKHRVSSFDEVVLCYSPEEAVEEAERCLRCDVKGEKEVTVVAEK